MALTQVDGGLLSPINGQFYSMKNRIINGAMMIDQRNAGASVTPASGAYLVDRWQYAASQASKFSAQQNAGSVTPPAGFTKYLGFTVSSAVSIGSSDYFLVLQPVEGFNIADLGWGTANAQPITVSFRVYSSLTGTFGGAVRNSVANRSYPFSYSISSANTWTTISVTIAGDTSGTWATDNSQGLSITFSMGTGSTFSGTSGAWAGANYASVTGATSVVGTSGATFYITGVQLEKGSTATSFDYRPYGTELALCQRYYYKFLNDAGGNAYLATLQAYSTTAVYGKLFDFPVTMRTAPTVAVSAVASFAPINSAGGASTAFTGANLFGTSYCAYAGSFTGSSGLVGGNASGLQFANAAFISATAEL